LPRSVDLVADAPDRHGTRPVESVGCAPTGHLGVPGVIRVLHPSHRVLDAAAAMGEIRRSTGRLAPGEELGGAEAVGLLRTPGEFEATRALVTGPGAVLPPVRGSEVAARPAHDGHPQLTAGVDDVLAAARKRPVTADRQLRPFIEHSAFDVAEESGFQEVPVDLRVDVCGADARGEVDAGRSGLRGHGGPFESGWGQP